MNYEYIFGDYNFIDPEASIALGNELGDIIEYRSIWPFVPPLGYTVIAARKVFNIPTWTKADKEAGRLPEVGCVVMVGPETKATITAYDSIQKVFSVQCENESLDILKLHEILPIETPEERAKRVREKWCSSANMLISKDKDDRAESAVIYDAILSGELKMPEVQK